MITYKIEYDLSELKKLVDNFSKTVENAPEAALPNTANAFRRAAQLVHNAWTGYLTGSQQLQGIDFLDGVTSAMVRSIRAEKLGDFHYSISSDNRQLEAKTKGQKEVEFDMKQTHPYGNKSRVSKKGIPYLIIPFRWGTPNQKGKKRDHFNNFIPQKNYQTSVKGLQLSAVNAAKKYFEANFKGESIERQGYDWAKNGRLKEEDAWEVEGKHENTYSSAGMVRMKDVTGSAYFTFRIVSAKSPADSWIYHKDAIPPVDMMGALERTVKPKIDSIINEGIQADNQMYSGN